MKWKTYLLPPNLFLPSAGAAASEMPPLRCGVGVRLCVYGRWGMHFLIYELASGGGAELPDRFIVGRAAI